jgi:thioredoxin reductase
VLHVFASMFRETNVPGVYASGDVSEPMKAVLTAALGGGIAAAGIAHRLTKANLGIEV